MLTPIAYGLAILLDLMIIFVGLRFMLVPDAAAAAYGVAAESAGDAGPYLTVKGLRDITSGLIGLVLLAFVGAHAEGWFMVAVALTPFGDTAIVLRNGGRKADAFGIHFATAVVVLISAALLFLV
ncbi:DUF4267 domain-containing protein [Nocardia vinacea]|uniref:DUF4267 domain-containing protein n=1 Tax=Nocardia vinacea TaxID=96468 RepID=UPI0002F33CC6|nr:DUF4267 domain-containing protein [Nocardia vinacea]